MDLDRKHAVTRKVVYSTLALIASVLFVIAATLIGTFDDVARLGGT